VTRLLLAVGLAIVFAQAAAARVPNPCVLVTSAEVAKVFGAKIADRSSDT
jgi:hypothetical protein